MTYQIPQQLQYKEKIMFGLTFKQLGYFSLFALVDVIIFKKLGLSLVGIILITIFALTGMMFVFFNLEKLIKEYFYFFRNRLVLKDTKKMLALLDIKEVKNNLIINKRKIAILRVSPVNFSLKPDEDRETIIYSFQKFLNSLDFSTQILMNTETINLNDYLDALKGRNDKDYKELFESYKKHLHETIKSNKLMDRIFYLVVKEQTNIDIQVDVCTDRLKAMNLKVERLRDKKLVSFLKTFFSPLEGEGFQPTKINNFSNYLEIVNERDLTEEEIKKAVAINTIIDKRNNETEKNNLELKKGNRKALEKREDETRYTSREFRRVIYASGYPRNVESGFLDKIVSSLADFNLSIHIKPYPIENMLIDLNRQLQKQRADLYTMQQKGISNPSLEIQNTDTRYILENLQKGEERLFNVSLYIICKAGSLADLNLLTKKVESELNSLMILPRIAERRTLQGLKSCLPFGVDELKENRNITTKALSAFFPFTSQFLQVDDGGVWLGMNSNNIPIIKDIFKLPNPNGLVLAQSGGGKSFFCKLLITRYLLNGTKVMIIDPQGEYRSLVSRFKGQRVDLSRSSKTMINPLDLAGHDYVEKRLSLIDLMQVMLGKMTEPQKSFMDKAISMAYRVKKISDKSRTWKNEPPILNDLLTALRTLERKASPIERTTITSLVNRLDMYVTGVFKFMNRHTNIKFNNKLVCFDIGNLPKQVKPAIMFMVLDYIYMKMKSDLSRKLLLIDESWSLLSRSEDASYIFEIVKTCRKFNMGLLMINQEVEGLFESSAGKSVLANSAYTLLMKQKPVVINDICRTFNLSNNEKQHLLTCSVGEGLLIMEDDHSKIKVVASPEEHEIITTNADEILDTKEITNVKGRKVNIRVDPEKRFFKYSKVSKDEREFLIEEGYVVSEHKSLFSTKREKYLLLPRCNESVNHFFVIWDIKYFLESKGVKVDTPTTKEPDLIFSINGNKCAIEVETGTKIKKDRKMIEDKIEKLKNNYDGWFFVITGKQYVGEYRKIAKVVEMRYLKNVLIEITKKAPRR